MKSISKQPETHSHLGQRAFQHLRFLSESIGPRPLGSPELIQAGDYLHDGFRAAGLPVTAQRLTVPVWQAQNCSLEMDGETLPAYANTFSPPCAVEAPCVPLAVLPELEAAELHGRIALLYGDMCWGTGHGARQSAYYPDNTARLFALLEARQPAAVLSVCPRPGSRERMLQDWLFPVPSASVQLEVGAALLNRAGAAQLRLHIDSQTQPGRFANLVAMRPGGAAGRIVVMAHYDSMPDTPGAVDNASGAALLLALAETLAGQPAGIGLEFLATCGEEMGGVGVAHYLKQPEAALDEVLAVINLDAVGQLMGPNTVTTLAASEAMQAALQAVQARHTGSLWVDPWVESDHSAFIWRGVPAVAVSSRGVDQVMHTARDAANWISPTRLDQAGALVLDVIAALADKTPAWCRSGSDK
jgi:aminopeptidase YwaD